MREFSPVQWLGLHAFTAGAQVSSLDGDPIDYGGWQKIIK